MRQVCDASGNPIKGLFRRADDSLVVVDPVEFQKNKISHDAFQALNNEVQSLKQQIAKILEHIHG
jgi:cell division protein FtsB